MNLKIDVDGLRNAIKTQPPQPEKPPASVDADSTLDPPSTVRLQETNFQAEMLRSRLMETTVIAPQVTAPDDSASNLINNLTLLNTLRRPELGPLYLNPPQAQPSVSESVDAVIEATKKGPRGPTYDYGARQLAEELAKGDAAFQEAVLVELARRSPQVFKHVIGVAGDSHVNLSDGELKTIADTLGRTYTSGQLPPDFLNNSGHSTSFARLISKGGADAHQLRVDFAGRALESALHARNPRMSPDRLYSNAVLALSNDPQAAAEILNRYNQPGGHNGKTLEDVIKGIGRHSYFYAPAGQNKPPLAVLLDAVAQASPPQQELSLAIFKTLTKDASLHASLIDDEKRGANADALGRLFNANAEYISLKMNDTSASPNDKLAFSRFVQSTVFNEHATVGGSVKDALGRVASGLRDKVLANGEDHESAHTLGAIAGNYYNGFVLRVGADAAEQAKNREFIKSLVSFAFDIVPAGDFISDNITNPWLKNAASTGLSKAEDQLAEGFANYLQTASNVEKAEAIHDFVASMLINLPRGSENVTAIQSKDIAIALVS